MNYYPNAVGVSEFLRSAWPQIRREVPDMECWIVGANPPESIQTYDGRDGVRVTGRVPSVDEYMKRSWIYIVPLTVGGGIRLKILEAMASGRAIVSTAVGCEGLDGVHREHLAIAELSDGFANAVAELALNPDKRNRLRRNARDLVEAVYDWNKVIPLQVEKYRRRYRQSTEAE